MSALEVLLGLAMLVGLIGVVLPIFPGLILIAGAGLVWALAESSLLGWMVFGIMSAAAIAGMILGTSLPARRAAAQGAPPWVVLAGVAGMVIGFFAIPVVGALVGFPAGVFVAEFFRHHQLAEAWRATLDALTTVGVGIAIQLGAGVLMVATWAMAVWAT